MICILALIVFSILGIFSFSHRQLAKEAFDCVFRRLTLRKCQSRLDEKSRSKITGYLRNYSPTMAKFFYKYFRILEFIFVLIFILSMVQTGISAYNFYVYGNCNGYEESGFCIFDPTGHNSQFSDIAKDSCGSGSDVDTGEIFNIKDSMDLSSINLSLFPLLNKGDGRNLVFFVGCYECKYTKEIYPEINKLITKENPTVYFAHFPIKSHMDVFTEYGNCIYNMSGINQFVKFNDNMFSKKECTIDVCEGVISDLGLNNKIYDGCINTNSSLELLNKQMNELKRLGVYGTPTVFINGEVFVGPKPYRVYSRALK